MVHLTESGNGLEAWVGERRYHLCLSDPRDRAGAANNASASGPQELRALMPGKIVKLLVSQGDEVRAGSGLIVVEAMKMQNEMKASKDGRVTRIHVGEGATVAPGERLLIVE
jgi:biotin carboxyl carrier protein